MLSKLTALVEKRRRALIGVVLAVSAALIIVTALSPKAAKAGVVCDLELTGGVGAADNTLKAGPTKIDLASVGGVAGLGSGCGVQDKNATVGVMVRASLMDLRGDIGPAALKSDQLYEAAFKAALRWHDKYTFYGLAGWSWTKMELPAGLGSKSPSGLLLGGGVEAHLYRNIYGRGEYTWHNFAGQDLGFGAKIDQDLHVFRIGMAIKFNDLRGISIEDEVPEVKPCDPKLAGCKKSIKP